MEKKTIIAVIVIVAIVVIAGGTVAYEKLLPHVSAVPNHAFVVASSAPPTSIDPAVAYDTDSVIITDQIYQTLITYANTTSNGQTTGSLNIAPGLATSWEVYSNGSVLFNLSHSARFSNGDPVNASDVRYSLDRVMEMNQGPAFHIRASLNSSGIHVLNTYQVLLVPSYHNPFFINLFQLWVTSIVDPNYVNAHGGITANTTNAYMADHAMGSGPYNLTSYTSTELVLKANGNYWGPKPNVTEFIYEIVPNPSTQQILLKEGAISAALNIPLEEMNTVKNYTKVKIDTSPTSSEYYIGMDENVSVLQNLDVRQAIEYALNRTTIVDQSTFGYGIPLQSVIAPSVQDYTPAFENYTFNESKATKLLSEAGYSASHPLVLYFNYTSGDPVGQAIATIVQSELSAVNVTVHLTAITASTFNDEVSNGHFELFYEAWVNLLANPVDGMQALFEKQYAGLDGNYNYFKNATVTSDLENASTTANLTLSKMLFKQAQDIMAQQAVEVPLFNLENVIPVLKTVNGPVAFPTFDIFADQLSVP